MSYCRLWGWVWSVLALAFVAACAPQKPSRFVSESIPVADGVSLYTTEAQPDGAVGGPGIERLQADIESALLKRGDHAQADGGLGATASWLLNELNQGHAVDSGAVEVASRRYGFAGVLSSFAGFGIDQSDAWRDQLERVAGNMPITRYGIRVSPSGRSAAVIFGSVELSYEAIPRALDPGQSVSVKGEVGPRFSSAHVYLTKPDGTVDDKRMPKRAIDTSFALQAAGKYRLETMGDGVSGPVVLSNVPLYVGVPEAVASVVTGAVLAPEEAEARALVLLNEARTAAGLNKVQPDAELREIALAHSTDMVDHNFVGHVSPTTGTPLDRVRRSGALVPAFGENVGTAATPELVHEGLMDSPGHRANMLRPDWTHVGIGARKGHVGIVVTMLFARRPSAAALPTSAAQVEAAVSALRAAKNLPAASVDPIYRTAAQAGADAYAAGADQKDMFKAVQSALEREVNRLHAARPGACQQAFELLELSTLSEVPALSDPGLRRYGVGAHIRRDSKGARLSTLFLFEGVSCK